MIRAFFQLLKNEITGWPEWWSEQSFGQKFTLPICVGFYWFILTLLGGFRNDHWVMGFVLLGTWLGGRFLRMMFWFLLPVFLTGIVYDSQRFYSDYIRGEIRVRWPYDFDMRYFGINTPEGRLTPNEWCQKHTSAFLDLITGFFYLFFIAIYVMVSAWHYFALPLLQKNPTLLQKAKILSPYSLWAFFWVNFLGYTTYYWFPAAPPWYVADHGLGPAQMDVQASAAGCLRFDQLLGTHFFTGMYGRSADVFGAIPSLHVAYPFLSFLFAMQLGSLRVFTAFFYLMMCFSAVYLNHHYIVDILWGTAYAILVFALIHWLAHRRAKRLGISA